MSFIIFLCLLLSLCFSQEPQRCSPLLTVDISNASKLSDNVFELDNVIYNQSNYIEDNGKKLGCICNIKKCIRKCYSTENFSFDVYREKEKIYHVNLNNFTIVFGYDCPKGSVGVTLDPGTGIFMQENGTLYYESVDEDWKHLYDLESYCVDLFDGNFSAMVCDFENTDSEMSRRVNGIGMLISMPFLFIILLVYTILPERNLHRRALICYVSCTIAANITLLRINFDHNSITPKVHCQLVGFLTIYFYLVSFFWLNVMCIDMWLAFSSFTGFLSKKTAETKKFIMYSIYAWGVPFCFVVMVLIINMHCDPKSYFHPKVGIETCFLQDGWPMFYFFYLPIAILLTVNILLFSVTALKIFKQKRETKMLNRTDSKIHSNENDKQNFNLYFKLMFAMGVNWITEIIAWSVKWKTGDPHSAIFYLPSFVNAMYGLFIFLIFVFKKKIWRDLQKRYYECIRKPELAPMTSTRFTSTRTRTSNCSTDSFISATTEYDHPVKASPRVSEESPLKRNEFK